MADVFRLTATSSFDITGIVSPGSSSTTRHQHTISNAGSSNTITIKNADANSTFGNRFKTSTGADIVLSPNEIAICFYDTFSSVWRVAKL